VVMAARAAAGVRVARLEVVARAAEGGSAIPLCGSRAPPASVPRRAAPMPSGSGVDVEQCGGAADCRAGRSGPRLVSRSRLGRRPGRSAPRPITRAGTSTPAPRNSTGALTCSAVMLVSVTDGTGASSTPRPRGRRARMTLLGGPGRGVISTSGGGAGVRRLRVHRYVVGTDRPRGRAAWLAGGRRGRGPCGGRRSARRWPSRRAATISAQVGKRSRRPSWRGPGQ